MTSAAESDEASALRCAYQDVLDRLPEAFVEVRLGSGTVLFANACARRLLGYDDASLVGMAARDFLENGEAERVLAVLEGAGLVGEPPDLVGHGVLKVLDDLIVRRRDGSTFHAVAQANVRRDAAGRPEALGIVFRDRDSWIAAAEERVQAVVSTSPDLMSILDSRGTYVFANDAHRRILGADPAAFVGKPARDVVHPDDRPASLAYMNSLPENAGVGPVVRIRHADGRWVSVELSARRLVDSNGLQAGLVTVGRDVTERLGREEALRDSERLLRTVIEASPDLISIVDLEGRICYANRAHAATLGLAPETLVGLRPFDILHPGDRERAAEDFAGLLNGPMSHERLFRARHSEGHFVWLEVGGQLTSDDNGAPTGAVLVSRDVSERVAAQDRLEESEARYRLTVERSPSAIAVHRDGRMVYANEACARVLGIDRAALIGREVEEFVLQEERGRLHALAEDPAMPFVESRFVRADGQVIDVEVATGPTVVDGRPARQTVFLDISERKRAQEALRESDERFKSSFTWSPVPMVVVRPSDGVVVDANESSLEFFGLPRDGVVGKIAAGLVLWADPEDRSRFFDLLGPTGAFRDFESRLARADGEVRDVLVSVSAFHVAGERMLISSWVDVSERKRAEEERRALDRRVQETQRLESLGVLAGGVAHDFNNLLVAIMGNASLALLEAPGSPGVAEHLREIERASRRAADLARQMLAYAGKEQRVNVRLGLSGLVEEIAQLLSVSVPKSVNLDWRLAGDGDGVEVDATQIRQVVMNLITNAAEAIGPGGGEVVVRTGMMDAGRAYVAACAVGLDLPEGRYAYFEVADTGCGMDDETVRRMFEPFFTTKFTGRGLGMSAVAGIVRAHGGALRVDSHPGAGTTIRVLLPPVVLADPAAPRMVDSTPLAAGGTILVIDDEASVCSVSRRMLERMGFVVTSAPDGWAGVEAARALGSELAGVLLDVTMPGLSGPETLRYLSDVAPDVPVLVMSGYGQEESLNAMQGPMTSGFLNKPFTYGDLQAAIRKAIRSAAA